MNLQQLLEPFSPPKTNFVDRLRYWAQAQPDKIALRYLVDGEDEEEKLTFAELDQHARAIAAELVSEGMRGQRALLLFPPGLEFIRAFFGCHYAGAIPVPAYPPRRNRNMGRINVIAENADAAIALTVNEVIRRVDAMIDDSPSLTRIQWLPVENIPLEKSSDWVPPELHISDVGLLQYTSGSTGSPKGVVLTHGNLMHNCSMITEAFQLPNDTIGCSWLPTYHDMGLIGGILNPLFIGGEMVLMSPLSFLGKAYRWLRAISKYRCQASGAPNFAYAQCVEKITDEEIETLDLSCWNVAFNGAEPIRPETILSFSERFAKCGFRHQAHYPCYGMAENTLIVSGSDPHAKPIIRTFNDEEIGLNSVVPVEKDHESARELVGCGHVLFNQKVVVVNPDTCEIEAPGGIGEIWLNGPSLGRGYWNNDDETKKKFRAQIKGNDDETFLRTGDLGFLENNELFVTGRLKDLIIVRGVNRYPQDIEATVEAASDRLRTSCAAAFSIDRDGREKLIIVFEVERGRNQEWGDVLEEIRKGVTAEHELPPDSIMLVRAGSIMKTSSGKIQRQACREAFLDDKHLVVASWNSWDEPSTHSQIAIAPQNTLAEGAEEVDDDIVEIVKHYIRQVAKERAKDLTLDTNIVVDLGLDSLERVDVVSSLEQQFGGKFPFEVLQEIETIREVAIAIKSHLGDQPHLLRHSVRFSPSQKKRERYDEIDESCYVIEKMPEYIRLHQTKMTLKATGVRNPYFSVHEGKIADTTRIDGRELLSYASYNYLGLSGHPEVNKSAIEAINQFGTSVSASRLVSGEKTIHKEFEKELALFLDVEDVITFPGGHATNESVIGHMCGPGDLIIHDSLAHNSIIQGAALSGARRRPFAHNDWHALNKILEEIRPEYRRVMIAIEGLYSMDGDYPDLPKFVEVKQRHKALLFVDEAHSIGTLGKTGRGIAEHQDVDRDDVELWMGTLSKSFGSCGGFVGGSSNLIDYLRYTTPGYVFAAGIPPANVGAALGALKIWQREPERVEKLASNSDVFLKMASQFELNTGPAMGTAIVPVITGDSVVALKLSEALFKRDINAQPIMHPAVEEDRARIRFFLTAEHTHEQIRETVTAVAEELHAIDPMLAKSPANVSISKTG